jgi:hypothetical protein
MLELVTAEELQEFATRVAGHPLYDYQLAPALAIIQSVQAGDGRTFTVQMARQAGKNETQAIIEAYLLTQHQDDKSAHIVKAAPTFKPQIVNSILRLATLLDLPAGADLEVFRERGYIIRLGQARIFFFSAAEASNVVGATASLLLQGDEAQDIGFEKWQREFRPMAAASNATTVLWGTTWTSRTLLARTSRECAALEQADGLARVFRADWREPARWNARYGAFVQAEIARMGAAHPLIRTQYLLQEADEETAMFPLARRQALVGSHARQSAPEDDGDYALLVDLGGATLTMESGAEHRLARHDATAVTVVQLLRAPAPSGVVYRCVNRYLWQGVDYLVQIERLAALARAWHAECVVVDATGMGAPVAAMLKAQLGDAVVPFVFSAESKAALGWQFLALVDTGAYQEYAPDSAADTNTFWRQIEEAEMELTLGGRLAWGVRSARTHDDALFSAALVGALERALVERGPRYVPGVVIDAPPIRWDDGGF